MVSFQCESCGDVVTRKKLDNHLRRCYNAPLTCIDCMTTFYGQQHKSHTSCITEAQKYEGSQYREKKGKRSNPPSAPVTPGYLQPSVEDAPDTQTPPDWSVARLDVPPPAPSPPPAAPINVFDFLVQDGKRSSSASARSSPAPQIKAPPPRKRVQVAEDAISYGNGAVTSSSIKYPSELSLAMEVDQQATRANTAQHRTPAPKYKTETRAPTKSGSEKKRKRPLVEELDLSESRKSSQELSDTTPAVLHSGLTGGLAKMLADKSAQSQQASPLSPKKRSKKEKYERYEKIETDSADGGRDRHRKKRHDRHQEEDETSTRHRRHKRHRSDGDDTQKTLEAPPTFKAIEYPRTNGSTYAKSTTTTTSSRQAFRSHSEFFLSLIDKGHGSHKGQSIYGTLKSFHDGVCEGGERGLYENDGDRGREERRLLKALRMKVNRQGEIVLFARPDFEFVEEDVQRRIEAA